MCIARRYSIVTYMETTSATKTISVFRCVACGETFRADRQLAADEIDPALEHSMTDGHRLVLEDVEVPRFAVGDRVRLHHAKSKDRRDGVVTKVGRTRMSIDVESYVWERMVPTTRRLDDADVRLVR